MKAPNIKLPDIPRTVGSAIRFSQTILQSLSEKKIRNAYAPFIQLFTLTHMPVRYQKLAIAAMKQMETSKDPFHMATHPGRMAADLLKFIQKDPSLVKALNMRALVLAIPLHDLSRALQPPTLYGAIYGLVTEKKYAAPVALDFMRKNGINEKQDAAMIQDILIAIDEHTLANTFDRKSPVSQWLYGLDCLDVLSRGRLEELDEYAKKLAEYWLFKPAMMWYKNWFIGVAKEFKYYTSLIEKEAAKRKPGAIAHLRKLQKKMGIPGKLKF
jgi:hypothetical protein